MKLSRYILGGAAVGGLITAGLLRRQKQHLELQGRVVLVTGATRGLGLVMARQLASKGARVAICGRDDDELKEASKQLSQLTPDFLSIKCDITHKKEVHDLIASIRQKWGEVEILINNAGIIQVGPMENMREKDYQQALKVHFWGPFNLVQEVLPAMKAKRAGRIVNIASINGKVSFPHLLPYTVSKFALAGFSEGITAELSRYNILVTSVYPGLMQTGSPRNIDVKAQHHKEYAWFKISDSIPGLSMSAEKAAAKIINAMQYGRKVLNVGLPAKLAVAIEGLAPGLNGSIFGLANKLLPDPKETGAKVYKGYESESALTQSALTEKTEEAEEKNNQL
ncbi:SDR family oxidoreductase [Zunongwangia sp. F363]|uniref:SDR family oxidoreductase n=1 Tax=Autumnicola tepida TaxID=3075595 RepID=A0ABU3C6V1_9FLAO|nr:SDR family oxidoreductase [Zunongwangia sp. F363]MDT0642071.1 SDR family oxidoreductase [Zunongwangia sp. F363]